MASCTKVSSCDRVMANGNLPNVFFSFLEPGKENGTAAQVCKKWRVHAEMQYTLQDRLNLNWTFTRYPDDARCADVVTRVLQRCSNLTSLTLPASHPGNEVVRLPERYHPIAAAFPPKLSALSCVDVGYVFCAAFVSQTDYDNDKLPVFPSMRTLTTSSTVFRKQDISEIQTIFPSLATLNLLCGGSKIGGQLTLPDLLDLPLQRLLFDQKKYDFVVNPYTENSCKNVRVRSSYKEVCLAHCDVGDYLLKFLLRHFPNLESLEFQECVVTKAADLLRPHLVKCHETEHYNLKMNGTQLAVIRQKLNEDPMFKTLKSNEGKK